MKKVFQVILLIILAASLDSCRRTETRIQLKRMMDNTVKLPERIISYKDGIWSEMNDSIRHVPKFYFFIDSTNCSTCVLSHLGQYYSVFSYADSTGAFCPMLLLSIGKENYDQIIRYIKVSEPNVPIYIDIDNRFRELNPFIPDDDRFHMFMTDGTGSPIFVGFPNDVHAGKNLLNKATKILNTKNNVK